MAESKSAALARELRFEVEEFNYDYAATLERGDLEHWPDFFMDDAIYHVVARDNYESGLPLGLVYCEGKGMLRDRVYALLNTEMYAPRYTQLMVTNTRILDGDDREFRSTSSYLLIETLVDEPSRLHQVGKYLDLFCRTGGKLLLKERKCVYDTVVIDNNLVFPV